MQVCHHLRDYNSNCSVNFLQVIKIGADCFWGGGNGHIYDHNHIYKETGDYHHLGYTKSPVYIGNYCRISSNCTILIRCFHRR